MIENRTLKNGEKFVAVFHDVKYIVQAKADGKNGKGEPKFAFIVIEPSSYKGTSKGSKALAGGDDGKTYSSLSSVASAIAFPGRWDGWKFFTREKEFKPEMAIKRRGEVLAGKPRPKKVNKKDAPVKAPGGKKAPAAPKTAPKAKAAPASKKPQKKAASGGKSPAPSSVKDSTPVTPKAEGRAKVAKAPAKAAKATSKSNGANPAYNSKNGPVRTRKASDNGAAPEKASKRAASSKSVEAEFIDV